SLKVGNLLDENFVQGVLQTDKFEAIIHFAGYISMEESMRRPEIYFNNNTLATLKLLEKAKEFSINKFIFSSTAGVYGNPIKVPIPESHPTSPENPYGESKLMVEKILKWFHKIHGTSYAALRYFNASGAAMDGSMGENHAPETHIIPKAIQAALTNQPFNLFGDDYKTKDGTCVRDYIHVLDLVEAHILALQKLTSAPGAYCFNVGTGNGFSNREIVDTVKQVSGIDFAVEIKQRRPGDADELVADPARIMRELNFAPTYSDLKTIITSAWQWHEKVNTSHQVIKL
ncbi:UDP-glucose 4-epimerase GalE, partial [Patescibacteria group bacterium]|nr:UDP-glucose 4-epimerase GalE [Patescibacteria group bacterium]